MTPISTAEENEPPNMFLLIAQGAVAGAFLGFIIPINSMLSNPRNGYNYLYQVFLPMFLFGGIVFGALEGSIIWAFMEKAGHRLNALVRGGFAIAGLVILLVTLRFLAQPSPYETNASETSHLFTYASYAVYALLFGLVTGSRFQPLRALVSGARDSKYRVLSAITGVALRVLVIFALMESVLYLIWVQQRSLDDEWWTVGVFAFIHLIAATVIALARIRFHQLATLALIINLPLVVFILNALKDQEQAPLGYVTLVYLALWAAFVLSRLPDRLGATS